MPSHFVGLARGSDGANTADYFVGTSSNLSASVEIRTDDAVGLRPAELDWLIERIRQFYQNSQQIVSAGIVLNG